MAYALPHTVQNQLGATLAPFRNREAALTLALFAGRFWSSPKKLGQPFCLDRRALVGVEALGLTEARVRGAIRTLEAAGYLERMPIIGRTHQRTQNGLRHKPITWQFGPEYRTLFQKAHAASAEARGRQRAPIATRTPARPSRPLAALPQTFSAALKRSGPYSPKFKSVAKPSRVHTGSIDPRQGRLGDRRSPLAVVQPVRDATQGRDATANVAVAHTQGLAVRRLGDRRAPFDSAPNTHLEAALDRFRQAFSHQNGSEALRHSVG